MRREELEALKVSQLKKMYEHLYGFTPKGHKKNDLIDDIFGAISDFIEPKIVEGSPPPASVRIRRIREAAKR